MSEDILLVGSVNPLVSRADIIQVSVRREGSP
jgi:hypothetical protein